MMSQTCSNIVILNKNKAVPQCAHLYWTMLLKTEESFTFFREKCKLMTGGVKTKAVLSVKDRDSAQRPRKAINKLKAVERLCYSWFSLNTLSQL